jgi:hypothetical protein
MSDLILDQIIHTISDNTGLHADSVEKILFNGILDWFKELKRNRSSRLIYLNEEAKSMRISLESIYDVETNLITSDLRFIDDRGGQYMEALSSGQIPEAIANSISSFLTAIDRTENATHESRDDILIVAQELYGLEKKLI